MAGPGKEESAEQAKEEGEEEWEGAVGSCCNEFTILSVSGTLSIRNNRCPRRREPHDKPLSSEESAFR